MKINEDIKNNTVSAENQVGEKFKLFHNYANAPKILFLGNSITLHEHAPQLGWNNNWGMAASCEQNDYVHQVLSSVEGTLGKVNYCVCNVGKWEQNFWNDEVIEEFSGARTFGADIVISRLGENVNLKEFDNYDFHYAYSKFLKYFIKDGAKVVVTDLFWEYGEIDSIIENICSENGYAFAKISDLGYNYENKAIGLFSNRAVALHPNDKGMAVIAQRILDALNLKKN